MALFSRLLLILSFLQCCLSSVNPPLSYHISDSNCTFYYTRDSSGIAFINCTTPEAFDNRWMWCYSICCQSSSSKEALEPTYQAFLSCNKKTGGDNASLTVAAIVTSIFMGICLCFFCFGRICRRFRRNSNKVQVEDKPISRVEWSNQTEISNARGALLWSSKASSHSPLRHTEQPCSICLDDNTNSELFCRHQYHPQCIGDWLRKNNCCPNCRMAEVKGVKVYCRRCRWRYIVCSRVLISMHASEIPAECSICSQHSLQQDPNSLAEILPAQSRENIAGQELSGENAE